MPVNFLCVWVRVAGCGCCRFPDPQISCFQMMVMLMVGVAATHAGDTNCDG